MDHSSSLVSLVLVTMATSIYRVSGGRHGIIAMNTTNPMNSVNRMNGVKKLQTGHNPTVTLKLNKFKKMNKKYTMYYKNFLRSFQ